MESKTGTVERRGNRWYAKISMPNGKRKRFSLPNAVDREQAKILAKKLSDKIWSSLSEEELKAYTEGKKIVKPEGEFITKRLVIKRSTWKALEDLAKDYSIPEQEAVEWICWHIVSSLEERHEHIKKQVPSWLASIEFGCGFGDENAA